MRNPILACGIVFSLVLTCGGCGSDESAMLEALDAYPALGPMSEPFAAVGADETSPTDVDLLPAVRPARDVRTDAPHGGQSWLQMLDQIAAAKAGEESSAPEAATEGGAALPVARGPSVPGDIWGTFKNDAKGYLPMAWDDTVATVTNPFSFICLGMAGAAAVLSGNNGDDQVERHFQVHDGMNDFWDEVGEIGGNPGLHFGIAGAMYFIGQIEGDTKTYEVSKTMLSGLGITGVTTLVLKFAVATESPNGDEFGWPSGHSSSSFCMATILYESYGPWVGVPAFAFAGFVGWKRLDARNHDFSDVISGALIGIAIGHAVSQNHKPQVFGMDLVPYTDPYRGGVGLALTKQW